MRRLIITGGGTGGHVYPALSIARGFLQRGPDREVLYVGARRGLESRVIPAENIPFRALEVEGFLGRGARGKLGGLYLFARAAHRVGSLLREFAPDAVVGTGGYVSAPTVFRAQLARIPTLLQEQNVHPGVANRFLSHLACWVTVPSGDAAGGFPRRVSDRLVVTGNPVRPEILRADRAKARREFAVGEDEVLLLASGGSGGAETINRGMLQFLCEYLPRHPRLRVIYVTGPRYHGWVRDTLRKEVRCADADRVMLFDYLADMPGALAACDLFLCRAGAMSLAEATAVGRPMVIVPSPNVTHDHQQRNARALQAAGAALVVQDTDFSGAALHSALSGPLRESASLRDMAAASRAHGNPEALDEILALIDGLKR